MLFYVGVPPSSAGPFRDRSPKNEHVHVLAQSAGAWIPTVLGFLGAFNTVFLSSASCHSSLAETPAVRSAAPRTKSATLPNWLASRKLTAEYLPWVPGMSLTPCKRQSFDSESAQASKESKGLTTDVLGDLSLTLR